MTTSREKIRAVIAEYDLILQAVQDGDSETDFVMRVSDYKILKEAAEALLKPFYCSIPGCDYYEPT
jgi:hypothetical protein